MKKKKKLEKISKQMNGDNVATFPIFSWGRGSVNLEKKKTWTFGFGYQ